MNKKVGVLGASGQLGLSFQKWFNNQQEVSDWHFYSSQELDITKLAQLKEIIQKQKFDYLINCAAYTQVDLAESETDKAFKINAEAVKHLSLLCHEFDCTLIHISTDFVFDGQKKQPLKENDLTNPVNIYGKSKLAGEKFLIQNTEKYFILRTGWLYSFCRNNFFLTMQKLIKEKNELTVVTDQIGTPTHTSILVKAVVKIVNENCKVYGIYHLANEGIASWYDFATEIRTALEAKCQITPILSKDYVTPAKRPAYSVLDKSKIKKTLNLNIPNWKDSFYKMLKENFKT